MTKETSIETPEASKPSTFRQRLKTFSDPILIPILAILTALLVASIALLATGSNPFLAYLALGEGALGSEANVIETLLKTTPFLVAGVGVALAFRGGLFNIGIEGQLFVGSIIAVLIGTSFHLPAFLHLPLVLLAGALGGAIWAAIPGYLKAYTGSPEVITTIMTNFIALRIITWLIGANGPMRARGVVPETNPVFETARLPALIPGTRLHAGVLIAILVAGMVYWLLFRTTIGFEIRMVGSNPNAARYAGVHVERNIILTMALSGALAGLAGAIQVIGLPPYNFTTGFNVGYGFDSIAVSVLGNNHPIGVLFSAFLFGVMDSGARLMQLRAKVPIDIISILQGLILMFVAANQIIRKIYRIRGANEQEAIRISHSYGGGND